ncbi:MAG: hypothetical protein Q8P67_06290, partial [archaeon]|nr:hypothetical protein [archaeon]
MARVCPATLWSAGDAVPLKDRGDPPCEPGMFPARAEMEEGRESLPLLIPVFNEEAAELWRTLNNLLEQQRHVRRHTFEVCIALDGWSRASESMKLYLLQLFPPTEEVVASTVVSQFSRFIPLADWSSPLRLGRISSPGEEPNRVTVVVDSVRPSDLRAKVPVPVHHPDRPGEVLGQLYMTLVAKLDNRRKYNSHMWFLAPHGFVSTLGSPTCFLTDCGTLFHERAIALLIDHMHTHPHTVVVSGLQMQMSAQDQGVEEEPFSFPAIIRATLCVDYLAESALQSWLHFFGLTAVIPGPCGLFRMKFLEGEPLRKYFEALKQLPHEGDLVSGNMRLVEDRVLTYFGLIYGDVAPEHRGRLEVTRIPSASFDFALEDNFQKCVGQRRRWINGALAVHFWNLRNTPLILASRRMGPLSKAAFLFFVASSIVLYFIVLTIPLLFSFRIAFLLGSLCESCSSGFLLLNFVLLVLFYLRHSWSSEYWRVGMSYFGGMLAVASALQFFSRIAHIASFALKPWHSAGPPPSDVSGIAQALLTIPSFL